MSGRIPQMPHSVALASALSRRCSALKSRQRSASSGGLGEGLFEHDAQFDVLSVGGRGQVHLHRDLILGVGRGDFTHRAQSRARKPLIRCSTLP